ncbi:MAG: hypothetical protein ACYCV7_03840 [Acidimicrobiales bacterium]
MKTARRLAQLNGSLPTASGSLFGFRSGARPRLGSLRYPASPASVF